MDHLKDTRGKRYATAALRDAANARIAREDADRAAKERAEADRWEAELRQRYMATPGATDDDWKRDRDAVVSEARKRAALSDDDAARTAFAAHYR